MKTERIFFTAMILFTLLCFGCQTDPAPRASAPDRGRPHAPPPKKPAERSAEADAEVTAFLGARCLRHLDAADRIRAFRIDWRKKGGGKEGAVGGYPILEKGRYLTSREMKTVKRLIRSASSYQFQWSKRARMRPAYAFRFYDGRKAVDICMDLKTRIWAFRCGGDMKEEEIAKPAGLALKQIVNAVFSAHSKKKKGGKS